MCTPDPPAPSIPTSLILSRTELSEDPKVTHVAKCHFTSINAVIDPLSVNKIDRIGQLCYLCKRYKGTCASLFVCDL